MQIEPTGYSVQAQLSGAWVVGVSRGDAVPRGGRGAVSLSRAAREKSRARVSRAWHRGAACRWCLSFSDFHS